MRIPLNKKIPREIRYTQEHDIVKTKWFLFIFYYVQKSFRRFQSKKLANTNISIMVKANFYMTMNSLNLKSDSSLRYSIHLFKNPPSKREAGLEPPFVPNKVSESQITHKCLLALVIATMNENWVNKCFS